VGIPKLCRECARYGCSNKHVKEGKCPYFVPRSAMREISAESAAEHMEAIRQVFSNTRADWGGRQR